MRALEFITGHVIYNPAYTYNFQLKTTNKHEKIARNNQDFFFCLYPKVSSYSRQKLLDVNGKIFVVSDNFFMCSIQDD
jgi:hypothetical protein